MKLHSRPVSAGLAVAVLAATAISAAAPAGAAEIDPLSDLSVPAVDITTSDSDLSSSKAEVVVVTEGADGPEVTKLRAKSQSEAKELVDELNDRPGVTAGLNVTYSLPEQPQDRKVSAAGKVTKSGHASEQYGPLQWGLDAVHGDAAWARSTGNGVTVAVIDTGVDATHPDLRGRTLAQVNIPADGATGDVDGHGTHVAGIVGAALNGTGVVGLAYNAKVLPIRVFDASGAADTSTVSAGIYAAIQAKAKVINMSLGGKATNPVLTAAVAKAVSSGITVVASAGNDYLKGNAPSYPANLPNVIGVAAIDSSFAHASFSNTGAYVDIAAPGVRIASAYPGGQYGYMDGTSQAAPFVAATAALVRAARPALSAAQVNTILLTTAQDDAKRDGRDNVFGHGLVRADLAVAKAMTTGIPGKPITIKVAKAGYGNVLSVDINPNRGSANYSFRVQKLVAGKWTTLAGVYKTTGNAETRSITLPAGTYRVHVPAAAGFAAGTSKAVALTAATVKAKVGTDKAKNKLTLDVDPNKGSGFWSFKVQKLVGKKWVTQAKSYKTSGKTEKATINLPKGKYRVVVGAKYGYKGVTTGPVTLVK